MPGLTCTLSCPHCFNAARPRQRGHLSKKEMNFLIKGLNETRPRVINMSGGEPILYLDLYCSIFSQLDFEYHLLLTTNGYFATSAERVSTILSRLPQLQSLQLSFDSYHGRDFTSTVPFLLKKYCEENRIDFVMTVCISDPKDLLLATKIEKRYQCRVIFQKIDGSGRAKKTHTEFAYPSFDRSVLTQKCPNSKTLTFIYKKGFSPCCANVIFNIDSGEFSHYSIDQLKKSRFHREVTEMTFEERLKKYNIDDSNLPARLSSPCNLCEFIENHSQ